MSRARRPGRSRGGRLPRIAAALALVMTACRDGDATARSGASGQAAEPRVLDAPADDADGVFRVLVYKRYGRSHGPVRNTFRFSHLERYAVGRRYLTGDMNAVIAGLFEGGADEVHVVDGHGSGNPEPDLLLDELDGRAELLSRPPPASGPFHGFR